MSRELTKAIGETERTMRALLEGVVATRSVTFPEWTTLVFTTSPLAVDVIVQRQLHGYVVKTREEALEAISSLLGRAWIAPEANGEMKHTADGHVEFGELAFRVAAITRNLFQHLPESDIATTVRTLSLISDRARSLLSAGG